MREAILLTLFLSLVLMCQAVEVNSIQAVDTSKTANQITIQLSGPSPYALQAIPGGNGVRLVIPGAKDLSAPQYPRLSQVLDYISARLEGPDAVIDIHAMGEFTESHSQSGDLITISLRTSQPAVPQTQAAKETPAQARPAGTPTAQPGARTSPAVRPEDLLYENEIPVVETLDVAETPYRAPLEASRPAEVPRQRKSLLAWLIPALAASLILLVALHYFRKTRVPAAAAEAEPEIPVSAAPQLFTDARTRMARKLLEQGWTAREIARELKLSVREVGQIISQDQAADHDTQS